MIALTSKLNDLKFQLLCKNLNVASENEWLYDILF